MPSGILWAVPHPPPCFPHRCRCPCARCLPQAQRQSQLEHLVGAKRLEDRVAAILQRVERELDDAGGWVDGRMH